MAMNVTTKIVKFKARVRDSVHSAGQIWPYSEKLNNMNAWSYIRETLYLNCEITRPTLGTAIQVPWIGTIWILSEKVLIQ